ncbi:ECF transporter S component [Ureibacillus thermosphaericus]|uniref:ECF transporter S component n=1 Tax=Ureibacillus thermosphaericus TaxID=51173 RepID=UPI0030C9AF67
MQKTNTLSKQRGKTTDLAIQAMLVALVFISTIFLNIKLPIASNGGLVHLGTAMLFIAAILFGPKKGAIAGAVGMGLFDLVGGWLVWAPITIISRALQGYIVGKIAWSNGSRGDSLAKNIIATIVSIPVMVGVYYIGEAIMFSSFIMPLASIPGDLVQNGIGIIIAIPVCMVLKKIPYFASITR